MVQEENNGLVDLILQLFDFTEDPYLRAVDELIQILKDRESLSKNCRTAAEELFSLDSGIKKNMEVYYSLT